MTNIASLHQQFQKELKAFIYSRTKNSSDANDILQDVFLKIVTNSAKLESAYHLKSYLYQMVKNAIVDFYRAKKNTEPVSDELPHFTDEDDAQFTKQIAQRCIHPLILQLPEKYQYALLQADIHEVPQKQLAAQLNITYSALKSRVQRGRELLKNLLLNCCVKESDRYGNITELKDNCSCS